MRVLARDTAPLGADAIGIADSYGLIDDVLAQPAHFRDALRRLEGLALERRDRPGGTLVCGMGGSAIGAALARAAIGARAQRPIRTVREYAPEPWLGAGTLVVCASYSGNTEETLAAYAAAGAAGAERGALTTRGQLAAAAAAAGVPGLSLPPGPPPPAALAHTTPPPPQRPR